MCYDISFSVKAEKLSDYLPNIKIDPQLVVTFEPRMHLMAPLYPKAPPVKYPVIIFDQGEYRAVNFQWNLIPSDPKTLENIQRKGGNLCNARSEKILDKHSVWYPLRGQRCLIPVTGIFEHREIKGWKNKVPYYVKLKDRDVYAIPGLYNYAPVPYVETGEAIGTFTLITRPANSVMRMIHNGGDNPFRMPLFMPKELETEWLTPTLTDLQIKELLDYELPSEDLDYQTVFTIRTSKPRPDQKTKIDEYVWEKLPELGKDVVEEKDLFA